MMKKIIAKCSLLLATLILASCSPVQKVPEKTETPEKTPVQEAKCGKGQWCYVFTNETKKAITLYGKDLLAANPSDYAKYCGTAPKLDCYNAILHGMSVYESGIDPSKTYKENFEDAKGNYVISTGLLQVSVESCKSYGSSANSTEDLKIPEKNLECSVRILNRWIPKDGVIAGGSYGEWKGAARYWSILRKGQAEVREKALGYLKP